MVRLIPSHKTICMSFEYFPHCREFWVLKSQCSCLCHSNSILLLCIYLDHVMIVNITLSPVSSSRLCEDYKTSLAEDPLSFGGLQSFRSALEMPELNMSWFMNKTYSNFENLKYQEWAVVHGLRAIALEVLILLISC